MAKWVGALAIAGSTFDSQCGCGVGWAWLRNDSEHVVHTVLLSPSSVIWYRPKDGDAPQQGR